MGKLQHIITGNQRKVNLLVLMIFLGGSSKSSYPKFFPWIRHSSVIKLAHKIATSGGTVDNRRCFGQGDQGMLANDP